MDEKRELTRRDFMRGTAYAGMAITLGMARAMAAPSPGSKKSRVVVIRDAKVLDDKSKVQTAVLGRMLTDGIKAFAGTATAAAPRISRRVHFRRVMVFSSAAFHRSLSLSGFSRQRFPETHDFECERSGRPCQAICCRLALGAPRSERSRNRVLRKGRILDRPANV